MSTSEVSSTSTPSSKSWAIPPFPSNIPTAPLVTISLAKLLSSDLSEHASLYTASKSLGFFYLDMRGCAEGEKLLGDAEVMFELLQQFFDLPTEEKKIYDFASEGKYFGYKGMGAEVVDNKGTKDGNEIYNMSKDDFLSLSDPLPAPEIIDSNRTIVESYMHSNHTILHALFSSLNGSLRLGPSTLPSLHRFNESSGCMARFIRTFPNPDPSRKNLGEHTDFGSLTILFNRLGGLQVHMPETEEWVYVRPVPGCAIVNLGDAMVKFTAGVLRSNLHRVVSPPGAQGDLVRHSLVYFCRPEHEAVMQRLEGGVVDEEGVDDGAGAGVRSKDWMQRRHFGRKIGFGYQKPGDLEANGGGTEGQRISKI